MLELLLGLKYFSEVTSVANHSLNDDQVLSLLNKVMKKVDRNDKW